MKARNGFVSNSSTSSWIIATTEANFKLVYEKLSDFEKKVIDKAFNPMNFAGMKIYAYGGICDICGNDSDDHMYDEFDNYKGEIPDSEYGGMMTASEAVDNFVKQLETNRNEIFEYDLNL